MSSYNVIEGSPDRKNATTSKFQGKSDRHLVTESNFFEPGNIPATSDGEAAAANRKDIGARKHSTG